MAGSMDTAEIEGLFREHYRALCGFATGYLRDVAQAEDLVQDVFAKLWEERGKLQIRTAPKAYLFNAVRNRALNVLAKRGKILPLHEGMMDAAVDGRPGEAELAERSARVLAAIEGLPEQRRQIFLMCRYEGLKYREVAERMGLSVKTVENQMGRALKTLREELSDLMPLILGIGIGGLILIGRMGVFV